MPTPPLDPAVHNLIREYAAQNLSQTNIQRIIARNHGIHVSIGSIAHYKRLPCLREQNLVYRGPGIRSDKKVGELSWREWANQLHRMQELKRKGSYSQDRATIELGDG